MIDKEKFAEVITEEFIEEINKFRRYGNYKNEYFIYNDRKYLICHYPLQWNNSFKNFQQLYKKELELIRENKIDIQCTYLDMLFPGCFDSGDEMVVFITDFENEIKKHVADILEKKKINDIYLNYEKDKGVDNIELQMLKSFQKIIDKLDSVNDNLKEMQKILNRKNWE